MEEHNDV